MTTQRFRRSARLTLAAAVVFVALLAVLPSGGASAPAMVFRAPFGPGSLYVVSTSGNGNGGMRGCDWGTQRMAWPGFDEKTGQLRFAALADANATIATQSRCGANSHLTADISFQSSNFTSTVSGLGVLRAFWALDWFLNFSEYAPGSNSSPVCSASAGVSISIGLYDVSSRSGASFGSGSASWGYSLSSCNSTSAYSGPGNFSIPVGVILTKGQVYQYWFGVTVDVNADARTGGSAFAKISLNGGSAHDRLKMLTIN
jgi:hypothetical protein